MSDDASLADRTILVTGGTSGIGRETVHVLAEDGATVIVHGRNRDRGERLCEAVRRETTGDAHFFAADFADFEAVRALAEEVRGDVETLDALVNNAGTWQSERHLIDATGERSDGSRAAVETTVAVNHCAHFLLTAELWPLLLASDVGGRVVTVSSAVHRGVDFDLDAFTGPEGPSGQAAYGHSKLANVLFASELARRAEGTGVTSNSCHPGVAPSTALTRHTSGPSYYVWKSFGVVGRLLPFGPVDTERGAAEIQACLASSPEVQGVTGEYFTDSEPGRPSAAARSEENARRLWTWTADVVDADPDFPSTDPGETDEPAA